MLRNIFLIDNIIYSVNENKINLMITGENDNDIINEGDYEGNEREYEIYIRKGLDYYIYYYANFYIQCHFFQSVYKSKDF